MRSLAIPESYSPKKLRGMAGKRRPASGRRLLLFCRWHFRRMSDGDAKLLFPPGWDRFLYLRRCGSVLELDAGPLGGGCASIDFSPK